MTFTNEDNIKLFEIAKNHLHWCSHLKFYISHEWFTWGTIASDELISKRALTLTLLEKEGKLPKEQNLSFQQMIHVSRDVIFDPFAKDIFLHAERTAFYDIIQKARDELLK